MRVLIVRNFMRALLTGKWKKAGNLLIKVTIFVMESKKYYMSCACVCNLIHLAWKIMRSITVPSESRLTVSLFSPYLTHHDLREKIIEPEMYRIEILQPTWCTNFLYSAIVSYHVPLHVSSVTALILRRTLYICIIWFPHALYAAIRGTD
jgi:hypothetical protein